LKLPLCADAFGNGVATKLGLKKNWFFNLKRSKIAKILS